MRWRPEVVATWLVGLTVFASPFVGGLPEPWRGALLGGPLLFALAVSPRLRLSGETILPFALGALLALSALWSVRKADSLVLGLAYLGFLLLPALEVEDRPLLLAFLLSALLAALLGVREFVLTGSPTWRAFGPFVNPNMFACFLVPAVLLGGHMALFGGRPVRLLGAVAALFSLVALGLTGSRGGALGLLVALVAYGASLRRRAAPIAAGIVLIALVAVLSPLRYRLFGAQIPHSHLFRLAVWGSALHAFLSRPWGWGFFSFEDVYPSFAMAGFTRMAHSVYLQLASEVGLLGGAIFVALVVVAARGVAKGEGLSKPAAAGLLGQAAHFLVESALYIPAIGLEFALLYRLSSSKGGGGLRLKALPRVASSVAALFLLMAAASGALVHFGRERELEGDLWGALGEYRAATAVFPLNAEAWERLGALQGSLFDEPGALLKARDCLGRAQALRPRSPALLVKLARAEEALGRVERAEALLRRASEIDKTSVVPRLERAECLVRLGRIGEAEAVLKEALSMLRSPQFKLTAIPELPEPDGVYVHMALAKIARMKGDEKEEVAHLRAALRELQSYSKRATLARALHKQGLLERAISLDEEKALRKAIEQRLKELGG